jgi:signal transduction histidine kinase
MFKKQLIKRFLLIFLPFLLLTLVVVSGFYYTDVDHNQDLLKAEIKNDLDHLLDIGQSEFQLVVSDLLVLSEYYELQRHLENPDPVWMQALAAEYLSYIQKKAIYDQIRYLDETGQEVVRVNYNAAQPRVVPAGQLQNKADRYYFEDTFTLNKGEVFISPLDLNIEQGEIEKPLKPMIRFGTPVFNAAGEERGIVIVNYLAENLLRKLGVTLGGRSPIVLLNSDGYWLQSPNTDDNWGFMYPDRNDRTFQSDFPETWEKINRDDSGQFTDENGLFTFSTIYPLLWGQKSSTGAGMAFEPSLGRVEAQGYYWKLVYNMPPDAFALATGVNVGRYVLIGGLIIALLAVISWYLSYLLNRRLQLEATLRQTNQELEEANQAKSRFVASMSHELRTPLNAILGLSAIILDGTVGDINDDVRDCAQDINTSGQRLLLLVNDILDLAKIEAGKIDVTIADVEIQGIIDNSVRTVQPLIDKKDHKLAVVVDGNIPTLLGDPARLEQVIINLLSNAIKFTPSSGEIGIHCRLDEGWCQISVSDNGIGIEEHNQDKVFDAFIQAETLSENDVKGTGLGLALSRQFMEQMGGMIWLESIPKEGSTFHVALPVKQEPSPG